MIIDWLITLLFLSVPAAVLYGVFRLVLAVRRGRKKRQEELAKEDTMYSDFNDRVDEMVIAVERQIKKAAKAKRLAERDDRKGGEPPSKDDRKGSGPPHLTDWLVFE